MVGSLLGAFGGRALGGALGGSTGRMIGSMAGSMLAGKAVRGGAGGLGGLAGMLGGLTGGDDDTSSEAGGGGRTLELGEDEAQLLIRAMCNAAKADGHVDEDEINAIVDRAGPLDGDDEALLRAELESPLDLPGLVADVPAALANDVYVASLMAVDIDTAEEVGYMNDLADGLNISDDVRNQIHEALGVGA